VGKDTFPASLDCLKPRGLWVSFGNSSGPVPAFEPAILAAKGSLLFDMVRKGKVRINVNQTYPLSLVANAHRDLEARKTTGSTVFLVDQIVRPLGTIARRES
jgi:NADPH2:quinone reductase